MPRMIRARRTTTASLDTNQLRDQFIRELTRDAERTLRQLSDQFNQDLERQGNDFMASLLGTEGGSSRSLGNSMIGLFTSAKNSLFNRPRTRETEQESQRSNIEETRFRLSQSQWMAEASATMSKGEKNA